MLFSFVIVMFLFISVLFFTKLDFYLSFIFFIFIFFSPICYSFLVSHSVHGRNLYYVSPVISIQLHCNTGVTAPPDNLFLDMR